MSKDNHSISKGTATVYYAPTAKRRFLSLRGAVTAEARARIYKSYPREAGCDEMDAGYDIRYDEPIRYERLAKRLERALAAQYRLLKARVSKEGENG